MTGLGLLCRSRLVRLGACALLAAGCAAASPPPLAPLPTPSLRRPVDGSPAASLRVEGQEFWTKVRARFPYHVQGSFVYEVDARSWVVVVAEPPPSAQLAAIQRVLGASETLTRERSVGYDGWVRDVVALLPETSRALVYERLAELDAQLFGTSYRSRPLNLDPETAPDLPPTQLLVSPWELHGWVAAPEARFTSLDGGLELTGAQLLSGTARGVFRSQTPGLVLWAIPRDADLCQNLAEARMFAVESDLPIGALGTRRHFLIAGRERQSRPEVLPPLRVESLLALASVEGGSLGQSFQRLSFFAGKLPSGLDWAPIFLSDELVDTEFGSLLNITDQLLKSWSMNGIIAYENFPYPQPAAWASSATVMDELQTNRLTFNWNTKGTAAQAKIDGTDVLTIDAAGALPITYLPEHARGVAASSIESRNRQFFSASRDPNLSRVTAYAGMYQLFHTLGVRQTCREPRRPKRTNEEVLERRTAEFLTAVDAGDSLLAQRVSKELGDRGLSALGRLRAELANGQLDPEARRELIHYLGGVTGPAVISQPRQGLIDAARAIVTDPEWRQIFDHVLDREAALADFRGQAGPSPAWLHTPTLVVSRAQVAKNVYAVGGHNLYVLPSTFEASPEVMPGRTRIVNKGGQPRVLINPQDKAAVPALMPTLKSVLDERVSFDEAEAAMSAALGARGGHPPRSLVAALADGKQRTSYWDRYGAIGWGPSRAALPPELWADLDAAQTPQTRTIRVIREEGQYTMVFPGPVRWVARAGTDSALFDRLSAELEAAQNRGKTVELQLVGFGRENVRGVLHSLHLRAERSQVWFQSVHVGEGLRGRFLAARRAVLDHQPREVFADGMREMDIGGERLYQYGFRVKQRTLLVRIVLFFKSRISGPVLEKLRAWLTGYQGSLGDLSRELKVQVAASGSDAEIEVWIDDNGDDKQFSQHRRPFVPRALL